jgi:hypothetical protein
MRRAASDNKTADRRRPKSPSEEASFSGSDDKRAFVAPRAGFAAPSSTEKSSHSSACVKCGFPADARAASSAASHAPRRSRWRKTQGSKGCDVAAGANRARVGSGADEESKRRDAIFCAHPATAGAPREPRRTHRGYDSRSSSSSGSSRDSIAGASEEGSQSQKGTCHARVPSAPYVQKDQRLSDPRVAGIFSSRALSFSSSGAPTTQNRSMPSRAKCVTRPLRRPPRMSTSASAPPARHTSASSGPSRRSSDEALSAFLNDADADIFVVDGTGATSRIARGADPIAARRVSRSDARASPPNRGVPVTVTS